MLAWLMLILVLLIVITWDSCAKSLALQDSIKALTSRLDDVEERYMEAQEQHRINEQEMQESMWRLACRVAALQHRAEALTARLDIIEEPTAKEPKVRTALREVLPSFERSSAR
jgi:hypothetical protein